jgi:hypothetical protein
MSEENIDNQIAHLEAKIEAIDAASKPSVPPPPETIFDHKGDKELTKELGATFDRAEAREDAVIANKDVPSARVDSFDQAFERTFVYLNATPAEKATQRDASKLVETVRENARRFGLELDDQAAFDYFLVQAHHSSIQLGCGVR